MADVTYRIIIDSAGGSSSRNVKSVATTPKGENISPTENFAKLYNSAIKSAPVALALKYARTAITTNINRVELRTGRSTYQQQLQWQYSTALKTASIAGALALGIATGNPLLAVAGVTSLVDTAVDYAIAERDIAISRSVENIGIGMANIRAGAGGNRTGRSGN